jgi:hypothetical protein
VKKEEKKIEYKGGERSGKAEKDDENSKKKGGLT